jgi:hypothetical protein
MSNHDSASIGNRNRLECRLAAWRPLPRQCACPCAPRSFGAGPSVGDEWDKARVVASRGSADSRAIPTGARPVPS